MEEGEEVNFSEVERSQVPYYFAVAKNVFSPETYATLVREWPDESLFAIMGGPGYNKMSLSERNNPEVYRSFTSRNLVWGTLHFLIKSSAFRKRVFQVLRLDHDPDNFSSRFEFSSMPASGGYIAPHTDIPSKVVTLVVPISDGTWKLEWGGGTDLLRPKDPAANLADYKAPLEAFDNAFTFPFEPNTALLFVKSNESWHSAGPFTGPTGTWRRSLTINIERAR